MIPKIPVQIILVALSWLISASSTRSGQETFPQPPTDQTLIYFSESKDNLVALPFEVGETKLRLDKVSKSDKVGSVDLKGAHALTLITNDSQRFFLFTEDRPNVHPPLLVRLNEKGAIRRVTAMTQAGLPGLVVESTEIIKPHYRVLAHVNGMLYIELRPRLPLWPGEYAFIGSDVRRLATFRVTAPLN